MWEGLKKNYSNKMTNIQHTSRAQCTSAPSSLWALLHTHAFSISQVIVKIFKSNVLYQSLLECSSIVLQLKYISITVTVSQLHRTQSETGLKKCTVLCVGPTILVRFLCLNPFALVMLGLGHPWALSWLCRCRPWSTKLIHTGCLYP